MAGMSSVELDHCSELVMLPGSLLEFTSRFLPSRQFEPLLPVYALRHAVSSIPGTAVDDAVKWAKLKWWSDELAADPASPSRHPVLRALWQTGSRAHLTDTLLQGLVSDAVMQIDDTPVGDEQALFDRLAGIGATEIRLELALDEASIVTQNLNDLGAATSLYRMISGFSVGVEAEAAQIPLNLLAKHNINEVQLQQTPRPGELAQIIVRLAGLGLDWFSRGISGLEISPGRSACRHLQLRWAMEERHLEVIKRDATAFLDSGIRYGPADAWFAWRFMRRLK